MRKIVVYQAHKRDVPASRKLTKEANTNGLYAGILETKHGLYISGVCGTTTSTMVFVRKLRKKSC